MCWNYRTGGTQRPYFTDDEINRMMEDELGKAKLYPSVTEPVVDIERFLEQHLAVVLDQHAELESTVLGVTEFRPGQAPHVKINRDLTGVADEDDDVGNVGRWRATMAHEAAHVVMHRLLFEFATDQGILFGDASARQESQRMMRCLKRDYGVVGGADWREIQANKGMAALLMPRPVFVELAAEPLAELGLEPAQIDRHDPRARDLAYALARRVQASRQAALIRLETVGILTRPGQGSLLRG